MTPTAVKRAAVKHAAVATCHYVITKGQIAIPKIISPDRTDKIARGPVDHSSESESAPFVKTTLRNGHEVRDLRPAGLLESPPDVFSCPLLTHRGDGKAVPVLIDVGRAYDGCPVNPLSDLSGI